MDDAAVFTACTERRLELADLLESLTPQQWHAPSLCDGWSVRTVAGHLIAALTGSRGEFSRAVLRNFGNMHSANHRLAKSYAQQPPEELVTSLRTNAEKQLRQPVIGAVGPLTDLLVHGADICIPLGLPYVPPLPDVVAALDFVTGRAPGFVPRKRLAGLQIEPSDVDKTWGDGAPLTEDPVAAVMTPRRSWARICRGSSRRGRTGVA